ncbi:MULTISPECIES: Flp family type IVb pilin [unclassified Bradyrhizobium]|uniref:Flp family type IVb pilin n=1 Tax=unclassified Bradyrhizobium TaxID=2631580 RepID=UPI002FF1FBE0
MRRLLARFVDDECGATAIEYCLIAVGLSIVIVAAVDGIAIVLREIFTDVSTGLK